MAAISARASGLGDGSCVVAAPLPGLARVRALRPGRSNDVALSGRRPPALHVAGSRSPRPPPAGVASAERPRADGDGVGCDRARASPSACRPPPHRAPRARRRGGWRRPPDGLQRRTDRRRTRDARRRSGSGARRAGDAGGVASGGGRPRPRGYARVRGRAPKRTECRHERMRTKSKLGACWCRCAVLVFRYVDAVVVSRTRGAAHVRPHPS